MRRGVRLGWLIGVLVLCLLAGVGIASGLSVGASSPTDEAPLATNTVEHATTADTSGGGPTLDDGATGQTEREIHLHQEYRLTPDRPGEYEAVNTYDLPDDVSSFNVTVHERSTVTRAQGFQQTGSRTYEWDETTDRPTMTLRVGANQTVDGTGPIGTDGDYRFVDVGDWALVMRPPVDHVWTWPENRQDVGFDRSSTVDGEGAAGEVIAFLGSQETYTRSAHGQTVHLVVPERATLEESPDAIFDSLFRASETLRVGDRDEEVFLVAAPTGNVDWGVRGVQTGDTDAWVRDVEQLGDPDSVWLHEYVHTRQDFETDADARWLTEAGATYYAARLAHEQGLVTFEEFHETLARGTRDRYADAVLADQSTWRDDPQYAVGGLVTGDLDRRTRLATDSGASFDRVFARLNDHDGDVDAAAFLGHLEDVAGDDVATAGERYTTTTARPQPWDASTHGDVFGVTPARFTITFADDSAFDVSGPYRNRSLGDERPLVVVPGERVDASIRVENTGGASGVYDVALSVDGSSVDRASGRLDAGERSTLVLGHEFASTGSYSLDVADERIDVRVREPVPPTVTNFRADSTRVESGETVTLSIDVVNDADWPTAETIHLTRNGQQIEERPVRLDVAESEALTVQTTLSEAGEYTFGLGDASDRTVTVVVEERFPTVLVLAGGGAVALLAVVAVCVSWLHTRRRRRHTGSAPDRLEP